MRIGIIGNRGVMGRRYTSILRLLEKDFLGFDIEDDQETKSSVIEMCNKFIIATPTDTHEQVIDLINLKRTGVDILCEKPITKGDIVGVYDRCEASGNRLYCVNQYQYLDGANNLSVSGTSRYDYFNHGKDGLYWDCFQVIAMARGLVFVDDKSPIWECVVNGSTLSIADMDTAYIDMIDDFLTGKSFMWTRDFVVGATNKVRLLCAGS